jgi:hypothetical protein
MTAGHSPKQCPVGRVPPQTGHLLSKHLRFAQLSQCLQGETRTGHRVRLGPDTLSMQRPDRQLPSLEGALSVRTARKVEEPLSIGSGSESTLALRRLT